ncbi:periplasmic component of zinc ABC transporter [Oleidesulfovibrio alaskensis G20]|jgi:zinc transport system substrate-binding protein|uniref:Periplasmic component of zinc ABC transporter n=1 Tax=Oleidesulfovibrio alaskensis (strain ATCC BAA-1058 / DSM 17464 / G20) TaxID=207559 RepID=Q30Z91_OLEA2|nr:zinc ABC transporter substrate-binding protein [Oleidesulfovibrio alaskensis]ABB39005.1 periplasmic component of zinc ABC transporter [Oleidesulfovibrio alaskensis G20]MBG0772215.1 zinc ABC transporter substrate-binding protein [Oleidesulfovibrio alaskensis]
MNRLFQYAATAFITLFTGLMPLGGTAAAADVSVAVSIIPQKYLIEKIAGDTADVSVMVLPGASPATYEPRPAQLAALAGADLYFSIGVPFESAWLERILSASKAMTPVAMDNGITKLPMAEHHHEDDRHAHNAHSHDEDGHHDHEEHGHHETEHSDHAGIAPHEHGHDEHGHDEHGHEHEGGSDPHVWLSPANMKVMARTATEALIRTAPQHAQLYRANLAAFEQEADALDTKLRAIFASTPSDRRAFMVFHPSWGYFAADYGLHQIPIELQGKEPSPRTLRELIETAQEKNIRVVFAAPQFSQKSAAVIARSIGGTVVTADPLAADWADNLISVAEAFAASFGN